ncbi:MAG TPA: TonB-dependent receptor [Bacteroidales bacterium]|nr:TonB-dependent receptor [Bacteroidales bacterium]HPS16990.1 TonB-dependent receptor [Bacteroidales bacterium]
MKFFKNISINFFVAIVILRTILTGAFSQTLSGYVYSVNEAKANVPVVGATVYWRGTSISTTTDINGDFHISKNNISDYHLVFKMLGYKTDTISVEKNLQKVEVEMKVDSKELKTAEIKEANKSYFSKMNARDVQVVNKGELYRAACCNLSESFETNASVDVSYSDAITGAKQIQLLGLSGIYSQVQTENIPMLRGMASTFGLNYIPGSWMESIQISKGTSSVINGYESITGQINVEYKKPSSSEKFFVNLYGNDKTRMEANLNGSLKINDKLSTMIMLHGSEFNKTINKINTTTINAVDMSNMSVLTDNEGNIIHWTKPDNFLDIPKFKTINIFNRWDYMVPQKYVSRFGIKYLEEQRDGGTTDYDKKTFVLDTSKINNMTLPYGFGMNTKRTEAFWKNGIMFNNKPWKSLGIILSSIYHHQEGFFGVNNYRGEEKSFYSNLIYQSIIGTTDHKFSTGLSYLYDNYIEDYSQVQFKYIYQTLPAGSVVSMHDVVTLSPTTDLNPVLYNFNRREWVKGAFFEYTYNSMDVFTLILGVRGDYSNLHGLFFTPRTNFKWNINETTILRGSAGLGYRSANVISENISLLASQRIIDIEGPLAQEQAANYGINLNKEFKLFKSKADFDMDIYRTDFINQVVIDIDEDPEVAHIYNLKDKNGKSFSNSYQVQVSFEPVEKFNVTLAYRINDAKQTTEGILQERALLNKYKGLITISYNTKNHKWKFDYTTQFNGPARISDQSKMPEIAQRDYKYSQPYTVINVQVSKEFKYNIEVYLGVENLFGFKQSDPITEPFLPYHTHFDTMMNWGPISGRTIYSGLRFTIK